MVSLFIPAFERSKKVSVRNSCETSIFRSRAAFSNQLFSFYFAFLGKVVVLNHINR